jgi:hypothetical protein
LFTSLFIRLKDVVGGPTLDAEDSAQIMWLRNDAANVSNCDVRLLTNNASLVLNLECGTGCTRSLVSEPVLGDFWTNVAFFWDLPGDAGFLWVDGELKDTYAPNPMGDCGAAALDFEDYRLGQQADAYVFDGEYDEILFDTAADLVFDQAFFDELIINGTSECTGDTTIYMPLVTNTMDYGPLKSYGSPSGPVEYNAANPQQASPCGTGRSVYLAGGGLTINNPTYDDPSWTVSLLFSTATNGPASGTNYYEGAGLLTAMSDGFGQAWGMSILNNVLVVGSANSTHTVNLYSGPIVDGTWHHVVYTRSIDGEFLYVDGSLVDSTLGVPVAITGLPTYMHLGRNSIDSALPFIGYVSDLHVTNTPATPTIVDILFRTCLVDRFPSIDFTDENGGDIVEEKSSTCVVWNEELPPVPISLLWRMAGENPLPTALDRMMLIQHQVGMQPMDNGYNFDVDLISSYWFARSFVQGATYYVRLDDDWVLISVPDWSSSTMKMFKQEGLHGETCEGVPTQILGSIRAGGPNTGNIPVGDNILITIAMAETLLPFVDGAYQCTPYAKTDREGFMEFSIIEEDADGNTTHIPILSYFGYLSSNEDFIGIGDNAGDTVPGLTGYTTTQFTSLLDTGCDRVQSEPAAAALVGHWVFNGLAGPGEYLRDRSNHWDDLVLIGDAFVDEEGLHVTATQGEYYYYGGGGGGDGYYFEASTPAPPTAPWAGPNNAYYYGDAYADAYVARGMPSFPNPPFVEYGGYPGLMILYDADSSCSDFVFDTCDARTNFDTVIEVVESLNSDFSSWDNWTSIGNNDDTSEECSFQGTASRLSVSTTAEASYIIGVGGYGKSNFGEYRLTFTCMDTKKRKRTLLAARLADGQHILGAGARLVHPGKEGPVHVPTTPMSTEEVAAATGMAIEDLAHAEYAKPMSREEHAKLHGSKVGKARRDGRVLKEGPSNKRQPCYECYYEEEPGPGGEGPAGYYPLDVGFALGANYTGPDLRERTLVAWVRKVAGSEYDAGSPFGLSDQNSGAWDGAAYGAMSDGSYPTSSEGYTNDYSWSVMSSSPSRVQALMIEPDVEEGSTVRVAVTYREHRGRSRVTLYVNDETQGAFVASDGVYEYDAESILATLGARGAEIVATEDGPELRPVGGFNAIIEEARLYNAALVPEEIRRLARTHSDKPMGSGDDVDRTSYSSLGSWPTCAPQMLQDTPVYARMADRLSDDPEAFEQLRDLTVAVQATKLPTNLDSSYAGSANFPLDNIYTQEGYEIGKPDFSRRSAYRRVGWIVEVGDEWLMAHTAMTDDNSIYHSAARDIGWLPYAANDPYVSPSECVERSWDNENTVVFSGKGDQSPHPQIPVNMFSSAGPSTLTVTGGLGHLLNPSDPQSCDVYPESGFMTIGWNVQVNESEPFVFYPLFSYHNFASAEEDVLGIGLNEQFVNESDPTEADPYWTNAAEHGGSLSDRGVDASIYWIGQCPVGHNPHPPGYVDDLNGGGGYYGGDDDCEEIREQALQAGCAVFPPVPEDIRAKVGEAADGYGVVYHLTIDEANVEWNDENPIQYNVDLSNAGPWAEDECLNSEQPLWWDRQAYFFRLVDQEGVETWAWASHPQWGVGIIPGLPTGSFYPDCISVPYFRELEVVTNAATGVNVSRDDGHIAVWKYLQGDYAADPTAETTVQCDWEGEGKDARLSHCGEEFSDGPSGVFDYEDGCVDNGPFGAFQLHDLTQSYADGSDQVIFSFNGFASSAPDSFGVGRNPNADDAPDYRSANNGGNYAVKEVYILLDGCVDGDGGPAPSPTAPPLPTTYPRCNIGDGATVYKTVVSSSNGTRGALTDRNANTLWQTGNVVTECGPTALGKVEFFLDRAINPGAVRIINHPDRAKGVLIADVYYGNVLVRQRPSAKVGTLHLMPGFETPGAAHTYVLPADPTGVDKITLVFRAAGEDGTAAIAGLADIVFCPVGPQTLEAPTTLDSSEFEDVVFPTRPCTQPTPQPTPFPTAAPKVTVTVKKNETFSASNLEEALGGSVQFSSGANGAPADGDDGNQIGVNKTLGIRTQRITVELDPDDASQAAGLALAIENIIQNGSGLAALSPRAVCERVGSVWSVEDETCVDPDTGRTDRTAEAVSTSLDQIVQCESDFSGAVIPTRIVLANVPEGATLTIVFEGPKCGVDLKNGEGTTQKRDYLSAARKRAVGAAESTNGAVAVRVPASSLTDNGDGTHTFHCTGSEDQCALAHSLTIGVEGDAIDSLSGTAVSVVGFEVTDAGPLLDAMVASTTVVYDDDTSGLTDLEELVRASAQLALDADGISADFALTPPAGRANDICAVRPVPVACNLPVTTGDSGSVNAMCMLANVDEEAFAPGDMPLHQCLMDAMSTDGAACYGALRSLMCTDWCKPCAAGPNGTRVEPPKLCPSQCMSVRDACPQLARTCPLEQALLSVCTAPEDDCAPPIAYVGSHIPPGLGRPGLLAIRAGESRQVDEFAPGRRDTLAVNRALNDGVALVVRGNATLAGRLRLKVTEAPPAGESLTLEILRLHPAYDGVLTGDFSGVKLRQASQTADVKTQIVSASIVDTAYVVVVRGVRTTLRPKLPPAGEAVQVSASSLTDGAAADGKVKLVLPPGLQTDVVIQGKADFSSLDTFEVTPGAVIVASGASEADKQKAAKEAKPVSIVCGEGCNMGTGTKIDVKVPSVYFGLGQSALTDLASTKLPAANTKPLVVAVPMPAPSDAGAGAGEGEGEGSAVPVPTPAPTAMPTPIPAADDNMTTVDDYFPIDGPGAVDYRKYVDGEPTPLMMVMSAPEEGVVLVAFAAGEGEGAGIEGSFSKAVAPLSITEPSLAGVDDSGLCDRYRVAQRLESSDGDSVDRLELVFTRKSTALTECFDLPEYCECIFGGDAAAQLSMALDYGVHEGSITGVMMTMYVLLGLFCCCTGYILYVNARKPERASTMSPLLLEIAEDEEYGNSPKVALYNLRGAAAPVEEVDSTELGNAVAMDDLTKKEEEEKADAPAEAAEEKADAADASSEVDVPKKSAAASLVASDAGMESSGSKKKKKSSSLASSSGMEGSPSKLKKKTSSRRKKREEVEAFDTPPETVEEAKEEAAPAEEANKAEEAEPSSDKPSEEEEVPKTE